MKIGELAQQTGIRPSRIRYYEEIGLLHSVQRRANGYRIYGPDAAMALNMILMAQKAGFTLEEIKLLMPSEMSGLNHELLAEMLDRKIGEIEAEEARLAIGKARLMAIRDGVANRPIGLDCTANAARVIDLVSQVASEHRPAVITKMGDAKD